MTHKPRYPRSAAGMSLFEVLIGIVIFAFGMMALVQLQGSMARSAGDANTRTVGVYPVHTLEHHGQVRWTGAEDGVIDHNQIQIQKRLVNMALSRVLDHSRQAQVCVSNLRIHSPRVAFIQQVSHEFEPKVCHAVRRMIRQSPWSQRLRRHECELHAGSHSAMPRRHIQFGWSVFPCRSIAQAQGLRA